MGLIQLKGKIDDKHYNEFIRLAKLNHLDQQTLWGHNPDDIMDDKSFVQLTYKQASQKHKSEMEYLHSPNVYLTEVCWDLN